MLLGIGPEHAGGGSAPGVRCKRIADSLPVVEGPDADIEVSHWRPQAGRTAAASDVALSTGSTKTEDTSSGAGRRQTVLGSRSPPQSVGPSTHLADVTQRAVNLDTLKFDNQELHKCWLERQVVPDGGSFLFANENQPHIEQDSRLSRLAAYLPEDTLPPKTAPKAFGWSAAERSREDVVQPESHPSSTTPVAEETSEATTVTSSLGAARFMQMRREVPQPKACQVPQTSLGAAAMRGRSAKARAKQRPSKSPGSLVRDASSRQQLVSPRPLSVRGLGDRRTGPVVADHKLGEDALRHSQDLRRETSAQKVSPLSSSLKERVEALTMTETERAFSAMNVNRRRTEMTNANKQKAGDASKETQLQASQATEDILREVGRIESPRQPAPIQSILEPVQPEIEPARRTNEPLADSASDTMQENVDLITDSIVATVEARACTGHEDDDVEPIGATVRAGPSREPLGNRPLLGEVFKSSTDNASLRTTSLRDDIANLTEQMRGIVRAIGSASNDGSKTATATSADSNPVAAVSPPMLTASMAQAVHNELERLIGAQDVSEDSNTKSSDAPPTLNTTATEISSSTREAVERLSSNPLEATSSAASQFDKMNRGPVPVPKRGSRQQLIRSPYAEPPTRSPARQQRAPRDISDERRKRLGTLGLARSENKANALAHSTIGTLNIGTLNISTIGTLNQGHRREPNDGSLGNRHGRETADGSLPFESVDTEEIIDSVVSNEVVANFGNAEESKKRPSTSWYSPAAARELVSEKKQAAEIRKREEEEKEKKRLEGMRRLESAYKARVGCGAGKPNPSKPVAKAAASQPAVPEQRGKPPPSNTSTASATEGSKPQSRGTSLSSFRPAPRKTKGTAARATTKRRPSSAGATSRRRWNEALEDMTKRESQNPRMTPQLGQQLRRGQSLLEETGSAALASLSDGGDISEGSRRFQEPRLATKIRIATRLRARNKLNLLRESQNQFPASLPEAWAESHEPSTDSHALSLQGDRRDLNVDLGFPYPWANEPTWQRGDRITDDLGWTALDPTQWPPTRHAQLGLTDPANRTPSSSDVSEPPSPRTDFQGDARSQRPSSYLTPDHRRIVDEVVAEQRWWRRVRNDRPPASPYAHHEVQGKRPPSRGGESCQPLGPTTPPSYENDLPETYTQYQPLIRSLERPASPYADVTDDDDESLTPSFVGNQDLAAERQESGANPFGGFHHRPTSALPVDPGYGLPDDIGGTAVADTIVIEDTEQLDIPSRPVSGYTEERRLLGQRQRLDLHWTSTQPSPADCRSPCGASNDSSSNDFALPSVSFESEEAEVVEGGGVFEVDEWQFAERPTVLYEDFARTPSARSSTQQVEETADEDVIAAAVDGISAAIEETMVKTFMCDEVAGEKAVAEKIAREKAAIEKAAAEHAAAEREVAAAEKAAAEKAAAAESAAAERAAEAAAEKAAAEKAAREKAAADKVKAAAEQAARDKVTLGGDESPSAEIMSELDETLAASEVLTSSPGKAARCVCGAIFLEESIYCMRCGTKRPRKDPPSSSVKKLVEDYEQTIRQEISHAKRLAKTSEEASLAESSNPEVVEVGAESQPEGHRASDTATTERTTDTAKSEENKATVVEQVLTSVMDDLLDDSLQVAQSARSEPALRYPTPNATFNVAAITEMFTEDSKSESDSADSERKTPPGSRRTLPEKLAEDPEAVAKKAALKAKSEAAKAMELASTAVTAEQAEAASEAARNAAEFAQQAHAAAQKAHALVEAARSRGFQQAGEEEAAAATTPTATTPTKTTMPVKPNLSGEDSPSDAKSTSSSSDSSLGRELQAINAKTDTRVPFGSLSGGDIAAPQKIASSPKEPPRPPSPPPSDMRSAATTAGGDAAGEYRGFRSRDEVADLVTGDLIQMLLTEAFELHPVDNSSPRKNRRGHSDELRGSKTIAIGDRSPPKRPVSLTAKDAEDKTNRQGYPGIDTSESLVAPFFASVMKALGVTDEESPVQMPVADLSSWLPSIIEVMRARESAAKTTDSELEVGEGVPRAAEASLAEDPLSPSAASRRASREHDMESWTRLLADALVEIAGEEVKAEPRVLGWRRPGYGEPPLSRFRAQQAAEGKAARPQQTWKNVKAKLEEATRFAIKSDTLGDSTSGNITAGGLDDLQSLGAIGNIDEKIDQLIEEGIAADEASWLDIGNDVVQVKNQVVQMIFSDLLEETAAEIQKLWPPDNG